MDETNSNISEEIEHEVGPPVWQQHNYEEFEELEILRKIVPKIETHQRSSGEAMASKS